MNCCLDKAIDLPKKKNPISQFLCENIIMVKTKVFFFFFFFLVKMLTASWNTFLYPLKIGTAIVTFSCKETLPVMTV